MAANSYPTILWDRRNGTDIPAIMHDRLPLDAFFTAELQWCQERVNLLRQVAEGGILQADWPESLHWSWAQKGATLGPHLLDTFGDTRLFGIEAAGNWQGLLLGTCEGHLTRLAPPGRPLIYVDFLESAPWNWDIDSLGRTGRYRGVGMQLMELATRWSLELGFGGRLALHALPQAERFYTGRCRMQNRGRDGSYHGLCYFELSESSADEFLRSAP